VDRKRDLSMIKRSAAYGGILHEVVEHNSTLYLAGIVAEDLKQDMRGQAEDVMRQLDTLLRAHDSDLDHVLQATIYLPDLSQKSSFDEVWQRWLKPEHLPARAGIGVADLGPGVLLEMVVIAAKRQAS
jgi:enamine deaminase RidA (YjgF/YER057c/UK114 family)